MTKTKSGRELEGTKGYKGPPYARRFFKWLGFGVQDSESDSASE